MKIPGLLFFFLSISLVVIAQQPSISYSTPQTFIINTMVGPLNPTNAGGAVPPNVYTRVTTLAGGRAPVSYDGNGGADAGFNKPSGIATDADGIIYVSDFGSGAIRKITPLGKVSTIGNVDSPAGITTYQGDLFVTSFNHSRIYKIASNGSISVFAGSGSSGSSDGTGTSASFNSPGGITSDATGNLFVADQMNNKIRKITAQGVVSTIAGSGASGSADGNALTASFNNPDGVAVDESGIIYVADSKNNKIRKILNGIVTTHAGNGTPAAVDRPGITASFNYPTSITIDAMGYLYVADYRNNLIRRVSADGDVLTIAGSGIAGSKNDLGILASFNGPLGVISDQKGNLFISDFNANLIRKITLTGYTINKPLPMGLTFNPETGTISGTPTVISPPTTYTITAYNAFGSNETQLVIAVISPAPVTFAPLPAKIVCDPDFDPGVSGFGAITYTSSNLSVATIVSGKLHIVGPGVSTITASNGITSASQELIVNPLTIPTVNISPSLASGCEGSAITFTAIPLNAGQMPSYQWMVNGNPVANDASFFSSTTLKDGDQISCIVTNNDNCKPVSSLAATASSVTLTSFSEITVSISSSISGPVCPGTPVTFTATPSTNLQDVPLYQWMVDGAIISTGNEPIFTSSTIGNGSLVECVLLSSGKCIVNNAVTSNAITMELSTEDCVVTTPNTFTPNGDGINDVWNIGSLISTSQCTVSIYNNYGTIIFQSIGYDKPWDGTYNGRLLPSGIYFYRISMDNGQKKLAGSVTILR